MWNCPCCQSCSSAYQIDSLVTLLFRVKLLFLRTHAGFVSCVLQGLCGGIDINRLIVGAENYCFRKNLGGWICWSGYASSLIAAVVGEQAPVHPRKDLRFVVNDLMLLSIFIRIQVNFTTGLRRTTAPSSCFLKALDTIAEPLPSH